MVVYCVNVYVKKGHEEDFKRASLENREGTRREEGNLRFDVLQSNDDPSRFFLYEVYKSTEAVDAHKQTEHYLRWREKVAPWMAKPREGIKFTPVAPQAETDW